MSSQSKGAPLGLTESWGVIEQVEEGSDAESIEVIQDSPASDDSGSKSSSDELSKESGSPLATQRRVGPLTSPYSSNESQPEPATIETQSLSISHNESFLFINYSLLIGSVALLVGLFLSGNFFSSLSNFENGDFSQEQLFEELKLYKEQCQSLKETVAELSNAVSNLKNELLTKKNSIEAQDAVEDKNQLFERLLHINQRSNLSVAQNISDEYSNSSKLIKEMLQHLVLSDEVANDTDISKLIYRIPEHLSLLSSHSASDETLTKFVEFWKNRFFASNENLINEIKSYHRKTIIHTIKHFKKLEKSFFKKLCGLKYFEKSNCFDSFMIILNKTGSVPELELSNAMLSPKPLKPNNLDAIRTKEKTLNVEIYDNKAYENSSSDNNNSGRACSSKKTQKRISKPKTSGMSLELKDDRVVGDSVGINYNSYFSKKSWERRKRWGPRKNEGCWYLNMGDQRSSLRDLASRSDWLFDRARFRRY